jgi:hypothetical protein
MYAEDRPMGHNWHQMAVESHYRTAVGVKEALEEGDLDGALRGIDELIDAMSRSDRRAVRSQLIRRLQHIIKWRGQPERRSTSWAATIAQARDEFSTPKQKRPALLTTCYERDVGVLFPARQTLCGARNWPPYAHRHTVLARRI